MATYFKSIVNPNTQMTASLHETISSVRDAFISCGFTRTVQSGSLDNITTLIPLAATNQQYTYDVFAFNDAWQATNPLFIKVRYMSGVGITTVNLFCQMGTAHNSTGSFTGIDTLTEITNPGTSTVTVVSGSSIHGCGDGSFMTLAVFPQMSTGQFFVFERLYTTTGQPTGSGFHMIGTDGSGGASKNLYSQTALYGSAAASRESGFIPNSKSSRSPSLYDGRFVAGLIYPFAGRPFNPTPNILVAFSTDVTTTLQDLRYTMYGAEQQYINLGSNLSFLYNNGRFLLRNT